MFQRLVNSLSMMCILIAASVRGAQKQKKSNRPLYTLLGVLFICSYGTGCTDGTAFVWGEGVADLIF